MRYTILATLGVLSAILGLASSSANAQSSVPNPANNRVTLLGESLAGLNSRSVEYDFQNFFAADDTAPALARNLEDDYTLSATNGAALQLTDEINVVFERDDSPALNPIFLPQNELNDTNQVKVQFALF